MYVPDSITRGTTTYYLVRDASGKICDLPTKYLKHKKNLGRKKRTLSLSARKIAWYMNYLESENMTFDDVFSLSYMDQQEHFINYLHWIKAGMHTNLGQAPDNATANSYLKGVLDFYQFIILEYDNGTDLKVFHDSTFTYSTAVGVRTSKSIRSFDGYLPEQKKHADSIKEADIKTLLEHCKSPRDKLLILLLEETGLRIGELLGVKYTKDIDYKNHKIFVRYRVNENDASAKYEEERGVKVSPVTFDLLMIYIADHEELLKNTDFLFVSEHGDTKGQPLAIRSVYSMFDRLEKRCGIHSHAHALRHYFANERRKAGWDMAMISKSLGHRNIATTEAYMNVEDDELTTATDEYFNQTSDLINISDFL